jgi:hypothetical protein
MAAGAFVFWSSVCLSDWRVDGELESDHVEVSPDAEQMPRAGRGRHGAFFVTDTGSAKEAPGVVSAICSAASL